MHGGIDLKISILQYKEILAKTKQNYPKGVTKLVRQKEIQQGWKLNRTRSQNGNVSNNTLPGLKVPAQTSVSALRRPKR